MNSKLEIFKNDEFGEVRTINENGKVLFCGSDIAKALGYAKPNNAISSHCKSTTLKQGIATKQGNLSDMAFITEGDVYRLITHSKLPSAEKFEVWVFDEVLPSIRQSGSYKLPTNPFDTLKLMFNVVDNHEQKLEIIDKKIMDIEENSLLNPGEYNLINAKVSERIRIIKRERRLSNVTKEQNGALFKAINSDIKTITGVKTRSQLRQKHLDMVLDFIRDWEPSQATMVIVNQLSLDF